MDIPLVDLGAQYRAIKDEVDRAMAEVIEASAFIKGRFVDDFEAAFADFCGARHCVGVGNGTDALHLTLRCLGIGPGDEVITAVNTFVATAEAISSCGATPVFCDVDAASYAMAPERLEERITERTRAIVPVHLYGRMAGMDAILATAERHDLLVVEDAAQAHGASRGGRRAGSLGEAGCFSFYPGKNLGAFGDAGAVVTDDRELATRVRMVADHGRLHKYEHELVGVNSRLDGIQAAILAVKLAHLEGWNERRRRLAEAYNHALSEVEEIVCPELPAPGEHVFHLYVIRTPRRDELRQHLGRRGIATGVHYPQILAVVPALRDLGLDESEFPVAAGFQHQILSLPLYPELAPEQLDRVVAAIREFFGR